MFPHIPPSIKAQHKWFPLRTSTVTFLRPKKLPQFNTCHMTHANYNINILKVFSPIMDSVSFSRIWEYDKVFPYSFHLQSPISLFTLPYLSVILIFFDCPQIQRLSFSNQLEVPRVHPLWNLWIFIQCNHSLSNISAWSGHLYFGPTRSIVQGLTGLFLASFRSFSWFPLRHSLSVWKPAILLWFPAALLSSGPWDMVHTSPFYSHVHNNKLWCCFSLILGAFMSWGQWPFILYFPLPMVKQNPEKNELTAAQKLWPYRSITGAPGQSVLWWQTEL